MGELWSSHRGGLIVDGVLCWTLPSGGLISTPHYDRSAVVCDFTEEDTLKNQLGHKINTTW